MRAERVRSAWRKGRVSRDSVRALMGTITRRRLVRWSLCVVVTLTVLSGALHGLIVPPMGLVRTFYATSGFSGEPLSQDRTTEISLAFLDQDPTLPRRFISVEWRGFWFLPQAQTVDVYAGADDRVDVLVDGQLVLQRSPRRGMHTIGETITLSAGSHTITVRYEQDGGGLHLNVQRAFADARPAPFSSTRLFPDRPGRVGVLLAAGTPWLLRLVAVLWLIPTAGLLVVMLGVAVGRVWRLWRTVGAPHTGREFLRRLNLVIFPALLSPALLVLFGPFTVYRANQHEFSALFTDIAWPWLLLAVGGAWALLLSISCVICLLSDWLVRLYAALLFAVGVLLWAQGNLLVADYGLLTGEGLDLSREIWRVPYETALWVGVVGLAAVYARAISTIARVGSQLLIALQAMVLVSAMVTAGGDAQNDMPGWSQPPEDIYALSRQHNVIHIVLDAFPSWIFAELLEQERSTFDRDFSGFSFFADHLGAFPTTRASMPAMLTGMAYRNEVPLNDFIRENIRERSIFSVLDGYGYQVHAASFHGTDQPPAVFPNGRSTVRYTIPTPYGSRREYLKFAAAQLVDLSLFRHVPHGIKPRVYNEQAWLLQSLYPEQQVGRNTRTSGHAAFVKDYTRRVRTATDQPVYTFLHVAIPHPPMVMDSRCTFIGPTRLDPTSYAAQSRCGLVLVQDLLNRLRALGVYDSSLVLLASDHGWDTRRAEPSLAGVQTPAGHLDRIVPSAMALLAVKPPESRGPVQTSYLPTSITDIPATIYDVIGRPNPGMRGQSAFQMAPDSDRRREYVHHSWKNADWARSHFDLMHLFPVSGRMQEPSAWGFPRAIFEPADDRAAQFEQYGTGLSEVETGAYGAVRWGDARVVMYAVPDATGFGISARTVPGGGPQSVRVRINGGVVTRHELAADAWRRLHHTFTPATDSARPVTIELLLDPPGRDESRLVLYRDHVWER